MDFETYLSERASQGTNQRYQREINLFFSSVEKAEESSYNDVSAYLGKLRRKRDARPALYALKHYFAYLVAEGKRKDNPAETVKLRGTKRKNAQLQDLFSTEELEKLLKTHERYKLLRNRNRSVACFFIYQGMANTEIANLELRDIDFEECTVGIKASGKINGRRLKLKERQVYWLREYIEKDRPKLMKTETEKLFISKLGKEETGEGVSYVLERNKKLFPDKTLNSKTVRQSVIANLLKEGRDLRKVQVFAGHKYPSSTERYRPAKTDELKKQIEKYHPLG